MSKSRELSEEERRSRDNARMVELGIEQGLAQARLNQMRQEFADATAETVRFLAWHHVDKTRCHAVGEELRCPDGWPPDVDHEALLDAHVGAFFDHRDAPGRRFSHSQFVADYLRPAGGDDE